MAAVYCFPFTAHRAGLPVAINREPLRVISTWKVGNTFSPRAVLEPAAGTDRSYVMGLRCRLVSRLVNDGDI